MNDKSCYAQLRCFATYWYERWVSFTLPVKYSENLLSGLSLVLLCTSCYHLEDDEYPQTENPAGFPTKQWERVSNLSAYGWSEDKLKEAQDYAEGIGSNAVIVVDQGRLIAAWGKTKEKYYVASVRKSYLSTLFGTYVEDGTISLDATLEDYGIDDTSPALTSAEKQARVKDLLTSTSGIYRPAAASPADEVERPERGRASSRHFPSRLPFLLVWKISTFKQTGATILLRSQFIRPITLI